MAGATSTSDIRSANTLAVCRALRRHSGLSRGDLTRVTGLTRPTVLAIVQRLLADGIVVEGRDVRAAPAGGRPASLLRLRPAARVVATVRYRDDRIETTLADTVGTTLESVTVDRVPETRPWTEFVAQIRTQIEQALPHHDAGPLAAVSLGLPGSFDPDRRLWTPRPNSRWQRVPMADALSDALGVPVAVTNIAAATLIGQLCGLDTPPRDAALVYLGRGIGSASVLGGRLVRGATGAAGELGHCVIPGVERRCRCGRTGCVETVTALPHLQREFRRLTGTSARTLAEMEASTRPQVVAILDEAADTLAVATSWLVDLANPEVVYLGGNPSVAGSTRFFERLENTLRKTAHFPNARGLHVQIAAPDAALRGIVHIASELLPPELGPELRIVS